jgi:Bacterial PH domain
MVMGGLAAWNWPCRTRLPFEVAIPPLLEVSHSVADAQTDHEIQNGGKDDHPDHDDWKRRRHEPIVRPQVFGVETGTRAWTRDAGDSSGTYMGSLDSDPTIAAGTAFQRRRTGSRWSWPAEVTTGPLRTDTCGMNGLRPRVVRSREQSLILLAIAFITPLMALVRLFSEDASKELSLGARSGFMALAILLAAFAFRLARSGVLVNETGVIVKNPIRSNAVRWEEIAAFTLRRRGLFPGLGHMDLRDGRAIPIYAISIPNPITRPNNRSAQSLVAELNSLLSDARRRQVSD